MLSVSAERCCKMCEYECIQEEVSGCALFLTSEGGIALGFDYHAAYTEAFCMDVAFCLAIEIPIYQKSGTGTITQIVDIAKVATIQGSSLMLLC
jgi:hypothetical protein